MIFFTIVAFDRRCERKRTAAICLLGHTTKHRGSKRAPNKGKGLRDQATTRLTFTNTSIYTFSTSLLAGYYDFSLQIHGSNVLSRNALSFTGANILYFAGRCAHIFWCSGLHGFVSKVAVITQSPRAIRPRHMCILGGVLMFGGLTENVGFGKVWGKDFRKDVIGPGTNSRTTSYAMKEMRAK